MRITEPRLSISARLTLWYGLSLLILLSVFVIFLYTSFHVSLHRDFEDSLKAEAQRIHDSIQLDVTGVGQGSSGPTIPTARLTPETGDTFVRVLSLSGAELYRSSNMASREAAPVEMPSDGSPFEVSFNWDGAPAHSHYSPIADADGTPQAWLEVTRLESSLHRELHRLRWLLAIGILLAGGVAIASGYGLARRALHPVAMLTEAAQEIQGERPGRRLPTEFGVRDELSELAGTLNALLERLDQSFEREQHFRADAAHGMFTPLSALRSEIDVALRKPRDSDYYLETLARAQGHVERLSEVVEQLLTLSRAESGGRERSGRSDVTQTIQQLVQRFKTVADAKGVQLKTDLSADICVPVDAVRLEAVLENLLDNALKFTPSTGTVTVTAWKTAKNAHFSVSDTGVGFTPEEAPRLFDRFYRADTAAVRNVRGSGLGLSIARAVLDVSGGSIEATSPGRNLGSVFEVTLPLCDASWHA